jgi:methionine-rich copper-binding protein CopC/putative copper export protein
MKRLLLLFLILFTALVLPFSAYAHATPISYDPESSATLDAIPAEVSIQFSEHLEQGASVLKVTGPSGAVVSQGEAKIGVSDSRVLSVPISDDGKGAYLVNWSVVSADDGHFTRGTYYFGVGEAPPADSDPSDDFEVVETSNIPEAFGMTVELFGHGIVWALVLLYMFAARPVFESGGYDGEKRTVIRWYAILFFSAIALILLGASFQIFVKAGSLEAIRGLGIGDALSAYLPTAGGFATLARMGAAIVAGIIFFFGRRAIFAAKKITAYEWGMIAVMCVFAYFRAKISHAAANPFFPDFSIVVNFFHLIDKDIWAGIALVLFLLALAKPLRSFFRAFLPRAFSMLAVVFASVSVTATYIVWLHLKSFENLFTTRWGEVFLMLLCAAAPLAALRAYHVLARAFRPALFWRLSAMTLAAEFALALLVVFYSSIVIITSPPLADSAQKIFSATDNSVSISLSRNAYEDGTAFLSVSGQGAKDPVILVSDAGGAPVSLDASKRYQGGYVMPVGLMTGGGPYEVSVTVPQEKGYDAHAKFTIQKGDLDAAPEGARTFDSFTLSMIGIGVLALVFALFLGRYAGREVTKDAKPLMPELSGIAVLFIVLFAAAGGVNALSTSGMLNPYKAKCEGDGNAWHLMVPMQAGRVMSETPREGCMWGMGKSMYMFPTMAEYDYFSGFPKAEVALQTSPETLVAGVPTKMNVTVKEPDGTPALMFMDMEKLIHMVVISRDQSVFAHIHADDVRPLTREEIADSSFDFDYTFPKAGEYIIAIDYAHGLTLESKQFVVNVTGAPTQSAEVRTFQETGNFDGYDVSMKADLPIAGEVTTMRFTVMKDGKPVTNIKSYLSAASHIAAVKNDFTEFIHTHGEVHPPGTPYPPIIVKDGKVIHSMAAMILPPEFGPNIEAHLIFPTAGLYTVWAQFNVDGKVIPTSFTVKVED